MNKFLKRKQYIEGKIEEYNNDIAVVDKKIDQMKARLVFLQTLVKQKLTKNSEDNSTEYHIARLKILSLNCDLGAEKSHRDDLKEHQERYYQQLIKINDKILAINI